MAKFPFQVSPKIAVLWIPILFSLFYALVSLIFTLTTTHLLTPSAQEHLSQNSTTVFWVSFLIVIPNIVLSFIMYVYANATTDIGNLVYIPCITGIIGGLLPVLYIYHFFFNMDSSIFTQVPVIAYGFPFVYFLGMCVGWMVGLFIVATIKPTDNLLK